MSEIIYYSITVCPLYKQGLERPHNCKSCQKFNQCFINFNGKGLDIHEKQKPMTISNNFKDFMNKSVKRKTYTMKKHAKLTSFNGLKIMKTGKRISSGNIIKPTKIIVKRLKIKDLNDFQISILELLKNNSFLRRNDIVDKLDSNRTRVYDNLKKLYDMSYIENFTISKINRGRGRPFIYWKLANLTRYLLQ